MCHKHVPRARLWKYPSGVSILESLDRRRTKREALSRNDGNRGTVDKVVDEVVRSVSATDGRDRERCVAALIPEEGTIAVVDAEPFGMRNGTPTPDIFDDFCIFLDDG